MGPDPGGDALTSPPACCFAFIYPPCCDAPGEATSLVGRESEIELDHRELQAARTVTLTGPGGSGKTRLANAAARASGTNIRMRCGSSISQPSAALSSRSRPSRPDGEALTIADLVTAAGRLAAPAGRAAAQRQTGVWRSRCERRHFPRRTTDIRSVVGREAVVMLDAGPGRTSLTTRRRRPRRPPPAEPFQ